MVEVVEDLAMPAVYHISSDQAIFPMRALQDAWIGFLRQWAWQWFCTFTFRDMVHPESAEKRFRPFVSKINRELYGPRWFKKGKGILWVRALEFQRRGVIHYHAMFAGVQDLRRLTWMDIWNELAGFARIEAIRDTTAVRRYVSKYVVKGGELDLGGPLLTDQLVLLPVSWRE
jgi:hypothetical protein